MIVFQWSQVTPVKGSIGPQGGQNPQPENWCPRGTTTCWDSTYFSFLSSTNPLPPSLGSWWPCSSTDIGKAVIKTTYISEEKQQDLECATTQALKKSNTDFIKKKFDKDYHSVRFCNILLGSFSSCDTRNQILHLLLSGSSRHSVQICFVLGFFCFKNPVILPFINKDCILKFPIIETQIFSLMSHIGHQSLYKFGVIKQFVK